MKKNLNKVIFLILALALAIVPVIAISSFAEGEALTFDVPLGIEAPTGLDGDGTFPEADAPNGYEFVGWATSAIDKETTSAPQTFSADDTYTAANGTKFYAVYSRTEESGGAVTYEKFSGSLVEGDYVIVYDKGAMNTTVSSSRLGYTAVTISGNAITSTISDNILWHIAPSGSNWTIYNAGVNKYAASTGAKNKAQLLASGTDNKSLWTVSGTNTYEFVNVANKAANVNANLRRNGTYGFATYATSTGGALTLYKKVEAAGGESVTYYSTMTSYTATFVGPDGSVNALRAADNKITVPGAPAYEGVFDAQEYKFAGWSETKLDADATNAPTLLTSTTLTLTKDVTYYAVYSYTVSSGEGEVVEGGWKLVTDASTLAANDQVIIAANDYSYAISTTQNNNNRGQVSITKDDNTVTFGSGVQIITLKAGSTAGTFAFYVDETSSVGSGYLYAAGGTGSNNYLRTKTALDATSSWNITITTAGVATIKTADTSVSRHTIMYNQTNSLFSCYASGQKSVCIYKYIKGNSTTFYATTLVSAKDDVTRFDSASVTLGSDLSMNYFVSLKAGEFISDYSMRFTFNGEQTVVDTATLVGDKYMFTFSGITPEKMGDNIKAELMKGDEVVCFHDEYSVRDNLIKVRDEVAETTEEEKALINATLVYGAAAQNYRDYNTDDLVAEIPDDLAGPTKDNGREKTDSTVEGLAFKSAGVNFDYCNRIYIKYTNTTGTDAEVKVFISGKQCATKVVEANGYITVYSDALSATELDAAVRFEIWQNGEEVQELKYSVYDYIYGMMDTEDVDLKNLVLALYNYGKAADACNK